MGIDRKKVRSAAQKQVRKGNWSRAIDKYERLVEDDPDDVRSRLKLADLYTRIDEEQEAVEAYREVGDRHADNDIYQKAVAVYKQAIRIDSDDPELHRKVGEAYHRLDRLKDAAQALRRAHKRYKKEGDRENQLDVLEELVRLDPEDVGLRIQLAETYAKEDRAEDALERFREAAEMLEEEGRFDDYVQVAERILYFDPEDLEVRKNATQVFIDRGDHKRALKHLQVCFNHAPEDEETLRRLAETFMRLDRTKKAVLVFRKLAQNYQKAGRTDSARQVWTRILDIDPTHEKAQKALQELGEAAPPASPSTSEPRAEERTEEPTASEEEDETDALDEVEFLDEGPTTPEPKHGVDSDPEVRNGTPSSEEHEFAEVETKQLAESLDERDRSAKGDDALAETAPSGHDRPSDSGASVEVNADAPDPESLGDTSSTGSSELDELLNEFEVFLKYGLYDNARDLIQKILQNYPDNLRAYEKRRELYAELDEPKAEASTLVDMAKLSADHPERARSYLEEAEELGAPRSELAEAADRVGIDLDQVREPVAASSREPPTADDLEQPDSGGGNLAEPTVSSDDPTAEGDTLNPGGDSDEVMELDVDEVEVVEEGGDDNEFEEVPETDILREDEGDGEPPTDGMVEINPAAEGKNPFQSQPETEKTREGSAPDLDFSEHELEGALDDLFEGDSGGTAGAQESEAEPEGPTLEDVDALIEAERFDDARKLLDAFEDRHPNHPGIGERYQQIETQTSHNFERQPTGSQSLSGEFKPLGPGEPDDKLEEEGVRVTSDVNHNSLELGLSYREMGMYDEAIEEFQEAIADAEAAPAAKYHIAVCKAEKGKTEEAANDLSRLLRYDQLPGELRDAAEEKLENLDS